MSGILSFICHQKTSVLLLPLAACDELEVLPRQQSRGTRLGPETNPRAAPGVAETMKTMDNECASACSLKLTHDPLIVVVFACYSSSESVTACTYK